MMHGVSAPLDGRSGPARPGETARLTALPARATLEKIGLALFALFIFFTSFTFLQPSPYDFAAIPTILLWLMLGIRLHRSSVLFAGLLLLFHLCLLIALLPYLGEPDPVAWTVQSFYLMVTAFFFVMFFSDDTHRRMELALKAYTTSCVFAAVAGTMSYFDTFGAGVLFKMDGRAAGVFEDPNVLGSFLFLGAFYLTHNLITGRARHPLVSIASLLVILVGIFLSFSRGSWMATITGSALMIALTYRASATAALRRRIVAITAVTGIAGATLLAGLLTVDVVSERFADRATVTKDYDEGETGRFGNQRRGAVMLIEKPNGFGPLRWRLTFGLEPHNSYIGGFANAGWLGGLAFIGLVLTTAFVGFRLCLTPSPYQRLALIVWPALLMFFLQAVQIDVDHWRHVYMLFGMVWALEAARMTWLRGSFTSPGERGLVEGARCGSLGHRRA